MPILLKRKDGEITPFRNAEYISAFYFIPKSILDKCGEEINSIPRNPRKLLQDRRAIEIIESDLFMLVIIDAYAFMVWPFMGLGAKREIYSGYEPSWRYAHAASIWIKGMEDEGVIPKSHEILKSSNVDEDLGYISEEELLWRQNIVALKILITERADKKLIFTASGITLVQKYPLNLLMK